MSSPAESGLPVAVEIPVRNRWKAVPVQGSPCECAAGCDGRPPHRNPCPQACHGRHGVRRLPVCRTEGRRASAVRYIRGGLERPTSPACGHPLLPRYAHSVSSRTLGSNQFSHYNPNVTFCSSVGSSLEYLPCPIIRRTRRLGGIHATIPPRGQTHSPSVG